MSNVFREPNVILGLQSCYFQDNPGEIRSPPLSTEATATLRSARRQPTEEESEQAGGGSRQLLVSIMITLPLIQRFPVVGVGLTQQICGFHSCQSQQRESVSKAARDGLQLQLSDRRSTTGPGSSRGGGNLLQTPSPAGWEPLAGTKSHQERKGCTR